jgi:hypothetical protein
MSKELTKITSHAQFMQYEGMRDTYSRCFTLDPIRAARIRLLNKYILEWKDQQEKLAEKANDKKP